LTDIFLLLGVVSLPKFIVVISGLVASCHLLSLFFTNLLKKSNFTYTESVTAFLSLLFIPQERNNHRALLLHPSFLGIFIAVYLLNQSLIHSLTLIRPGILGYSSEITTSKVVSLTNSQRTALGLPPLRLSSALSRSAEAKAKDMFADNYWAHNSPKGKTPWYFFRQANYRYSIAGENLARDFYDTDSVLRAWMRSPTHRANIVSTKYQEIGVAVVNGVLGGVTTTLVVQHFGTPVSPVLAASSVNDHDLSDTALPAVNLVPETRVIVSPLQISKVIGLGMFLIIISVLIVDAYITVKNQTYRLSGSSTGHIGFLAIVFLLMLFTRQGSIF